LWLIFTSVVLFTISAALWGAIGTVGTYWPLLMVALGALLLLRPLFRAHRADASSSLTTGEKEK
jgi:hypothetical protein